MASKMIGGQLYESCECGGVFMRGQWVRVGERVADDEVLRRVWAVYRNGELQGIKVSIETGYGLTERRHEGKRYGWVFRGGSMHMNMVLQ